MNPTASLSDTERAMVFATVRRLRDTRGTSILFISHFLDDVLELCQSVTVLRDGATVLDDSREAIDEQRLIAAIVGRDGVLGKVDRSALTQRIRADAASERPLVSWPSARHRSRGATRGNCRSGGPPRLWPQRDHACDLRRRSKSDWCGYFGGAPGQADNCCGHCGRHRSRTRRPQAASPFHG